ncbi:FAD-binding oxidoreductase [Sphingomonas profundi]|uniref:FAD-binding oxidoreductase n=1 Tax=Alterirhizorhabdus profundi TaxID=2681549 RepID=UPI0018D14C04|nr:FAD-binding oxidoreductase [Sphingomonas profundi]
MMPRRDVLAGAGAMAASVATGMRVEARTPDRRAIAALRGRLSGALFLPGDAAYPTVRQGKGTTPVEDRRPAVIVQPDSPADVARALEFARTQQLGVAVRSGGHDLLGASTPDGGVLIDLARLDRLALDPAARTLHAGGGARAGALTAAGAPYGLVPTLGMNPNVGIGGLTLGGGVGWLSGTCGATVDNLLSVDLVTADGRLLRADADEHPDLFWALRGGGGNFGVATGFTYRLHSVPQVLAGDIGFRADPAALLRFLRDYLARSPDALEIGVLFTLGKTPMAIVRLCWSGELAAGEKALAPLRAFAPAVIDTVKAQGFAAFAGAAPRFDTMFLRGGEFAGLSEPVIETFAGIVAAGGPQDCMIGVLHYIHGALCRAPAEATPFLRAEGNILYNIVAPWQGREAVPDKMAWAISASEALRPVNAARIYPNYLSYDGEDYVRAAFGPHYDRLRAVKRRYDPANVFRNNRNIRA